MVHPWHILAGLGTVKRDELSSFIAMFQDASLLKLTADRIADLNPFGEAADEERSSYRRRLEETAARLSTMDDDTLRLMLWAELRGALDCPADVPLSIRTGMTAGADVAHRACEVLAGQLKGEAVLPEDADWLERAKHLAEKAKSAVGLADTPDFQSVVIAQASRLVAEAIKNGTLDEEQKKEIIETFRNRLDEEPPELRNAASMRAVQRGDAAIIGLLAGGGALVGGGVAVKIEPPRDCRRPFGLSYAATCVSSRMA